MTHATLGQQKEAATIYLANLSNQETKKTHRDRERERGNEKETEKGSQMPTTLKKIK